MTVTNIQIGGNHYKGLAIQPIEIAHKNNLCFRVFSTLKYMFRHNKEGGEKDTDIKKAIHYLQILLEQEYGIVSEITYISIVKNVDIKHTENKQEFHNWCSDNDCEKCNNRQRELHTALEVELNKKYS